MFLERMEMNPLVLLFSIVYIIESGFSKPSVMNEKYSSPKKKKSRVDKMELKKQEYESFVFLYFFLLM